MKICLNYYGQLRNINILKETFLKHLYSTEYTYDIVYTTWKNEDTQAFESFFPEAFVNKIDEPNMEDYTNILNNYEIDIGNSRKTLEHYLKGLYVKQKSYNTVIKFEKENDILFDIIITIRTDAYLNKNLSQFYNYIFDISIQNSNVVFTGCEPCFAVYNQKALPDTMVISINNTLKRTLYQLSILENCVVINTNFFHPESSFYNALIYQNLDIIELPFGAFPEPI